MQGPLGGLRVTKQLHQTARNPFLVAQDDQLIPLSLGLSWSPKKSPDGETAQLIPGKGKAILKIVSCYVLWRVIDCMWQ